jgi:hypothetical protein
MSATVGTCNVGLRLVYLCTEFHMPSANRLLVTAVKPKHKEKFRTADILLFYILEKKSFQRNVSYFSKIHCRTPFQDNHVRGAGVVPAS